MKTQNLSIQQRYRRLLIIGFIFILLVSFLTIYMMTKRMSAETEKDVEEVAATYIQGVAAEELYHFQAIAEIRFKQVDYILRGMEEIGDFRDTESVHESLRFFGQLQELPTLALIDAAGNYETIYGSELVSIDNNDFVLDNLNSGLVATTGANNDNQQLILWCVPARYPMSSGKTSSGIICSRPMELFIEKMNLNADGTLAFFHLIREDGTYVVHNSDTVGDTFFEKLARYAIGVHRPTEDIIADFKEAISNQQDCSWVVEYDNGSTEFFGRRTSYAFPLPNSDWYIVAIMPYNALGTMVEDMGATRANAMYAGVTVIALSILIVFLLYWRMSQNQMHLLEAAHAQAEAASQESQRARIAAEEAREEAIAANKAKSEFLSNMSHDIRTPMNAIVGMTAIASDHIDEPARVMDCLKKISLSGKQLLGLINDVLDMSKIESGKMTLNPEALSLKQTMETMCDIVRPQIKANGQHFDIIISNIIAEEVYCDSVRINQVLLNFLSNAMKFTPEGGEIDIELSQEESPKGRNYVRTHLTVRDTGMGMSEEFKKKLFTAFEREDNLRVHKTQGTGLGLTITKYIVDAMGGTIDVESEVGVGTAFHVTVDQERVDVSAEEMKLPDWRVLVVDDNEDLCRTAILSLAELGTRAECCLSGEEAVEKALAAKREGDGYFVILIDYKMDGMSGVETAKKIHELVGSDLPIKLISAYDWADIEDEAKAAGITGFIPKPLFKSTLYHELRKYLSDTEHRQEAVPIQETIDIAGMKILVAEDNDINAEIARMILEESGCIVDRAEDGVIAAEMVENSEEGYYDAILMDLRMPHMGGIDSTKRIRAMQRADAAAIPIIAMTADAFAEDAQKCLAAGMNAHLAKPIDIDQLKKTLAKFVYGEKK